MAEEGTLKRLEARAKRRGFRGRSDAYRWLRRRHASLAKLFAEHEPAWSEVAAEMAAAGVEGGRGKPLTGDAVRRMWARVCRDIAADAAKRTPKPPAEAARWTPKVVAAGKPAGSGAAEQEGYDVWADIDRRSGRA